MINNYKIYRITQYIKASSFEFEVDEVIEGLESILAYYNVFDYLSKEEYHILMDELLALAEQFEFSEVSYLVAQEDPLIGQLPEREFCLRMESIDRKLLRSRAQMIALA